MAATSRWSMSARQTFTVGVLVVAGIFVLACGVGMTNIAVGGLGMAVAILGPLLIVMTGLRGGTRDYAYGMAHVHEVSALPPTGTVGRCELQLLVNAEGVNGVPVHVRDPLVPISKWPDVGATLPVKVNIRDPRDVRVLWDEVRTHREIEFEDELDEENGFDEEHGFDDNGGTDNDPESDFEEEFRDFPSDGSRGIEDPTVEEFADDVAANLFGFDDGLYPSSPGQDFPEQRQDAPARQDAPEQQDASERVGQSQPAEVLLTKSPPVEPPPPASNGVSVTLIVSDLDRSRTFYRDLLGLTQIDTGRSTAVLAFGDARVVLRQVSDMPPIDRRVVHLNLDVPDVQEAYDRLRAKGVEFAHRPRVVPQGEHLELCSATFRDPDGHAIAITRWMVRR